MGFKYLLTCSCGKKKPVELRQAGETVQCQCGALLQVSAMREIKKLEPYDPHGGNSTLGQVSTWGRREGRMLIGALLTVTGLGLLAYVQTTRPRLPKIESLSPIQTWVLWQDLRSGPDRHLNQLDKQYLERRAANRVATATAIGLAVVGILVMVAASLMRKRRPTRQSRRQDTGPAEAAPAVSRYRPSITVQPRHSR
jgi:hypothetical protein